MTAAFIENTDDARVVRIDGHTSDEQIDSLRRLLLNGQRLPTILDLSDLVLGGGSVAAVIEDLVASSGAMCIVVRRATAGLLLDRLGIAARVPVFGSVGDALQALRMAAEGYGPGWATTRVPDGDSAAEQSEHIDHRGRLGNGSREPSRPVVAPQTAPSTAA